MSLKDIYFDIYNPNVIYALFYMSMKIRKKSPAIEAALFEMCDNNQLVVKSNYGKRYGTYFQENRLYQVTRIKIANMIKTFFKEFEISKEDLEQSINEPEHQYRFFLSQNTIDWMNPYVNSNKTFRRILIENGNVLKFYIPVYQLYITYEYFKGKNIKRLIKIFGKDAVEKTLMSPLNPMEIEWNKTLIEEENKIIEEFETKKKANRDLKYKEIDDCIKNVVYTNDKVSSLLKSINEKFNAENKMLEEELTKEIKKLNQQLKEIKTTA